MKYITSKKTFPISLVESKVALTALESRRGATFVYAEGDLVFRIRAREFDYPFIMREMNRALELHKIKRDSVSETKNEQARPEAPGQSSSTKLNREDPSMGLFSKKSEEKKPGKPAAAAAPGAQASKPNDQKSSEPVSQAAKPVGAPASTTPSTVPGRLMSDVDARFAAYGKIISILERDPRFAEMPLRQINGFIGSAIVVGQYAVIHAQPQGSETAGPPIAAVLWANVSEEVDRKLTEGVNTTLSLTPEDWKSGDIPWLMLSAGAEKAINAVMKAMSDKLPPGRSFKARIIDGQGNPRITTLSFVERSAAS